MPPLPRQTLRPFGLSVTFRPIQILLIALFSSSMPALRLVAAQASYPGNVADAASGTSVAPKRALNVDEILLGLDHAEARIRGFRVGVDMKIRMAADREPGTYVDLEAHTSVLMDGFGRFRFSERGTSVNWSPSASVHPIHIEAAFDGIILRQMSGSDRFATGLESSQPSDASTRLDLSQFLFVYQGKSVAQWLREREGKVVGREQIEGGNAVVLETRPKLVDGIEWKQRFIVLPEKGFAVVCRSALKRYTESPEWFEYTRTESFELTVCGEGLFVPGRGVYQSWTIPKADALNGKRPFPNAWRYELSFQKWKVNPLVTDADFALQFEPGVFINDRNSGRSYTFGEELRPEK
ncbi:hypothetical protein ACXR0O_27655 [Verrucomicrobiota bacterium sgz303538]